MAHLDGDRRGARHRIKQHLAWLQRRREQHSMAHARPQHRLVRPAARAARVFRREEALGVASHPAARERQRDDDARRQPQSAHLEVEVCHLSSPPVPPLRARRHGGRDLRRARCRRTVATARRGRVAQRGAAEARRARVGGERQRAAPRRGEAERAVPEGRVVRCLRERAEVTLCLLGCGFGSGAGCVPPRRAAGEPWHLGAGGPNSGGPTVQMSAGGDQRHERHHGYEGQPALVTRCGEPRERRRVAHLQRIVGRISTGGRGRGQQEGRGRAEITPRSGRDHGALRRGRSLPLRRAPTPRSRPPPPRKMPRRRRRGHCRRRGAAAALPTPRLRAAHARKTRRSLAAPPRERSAARARPWAARRRLWRRRRARPSGSHRTPRWRVRGRRVALRPRPCRPTAPAPPPPLA